MQHAKETCTLSFGGAGDEIRLGKLDAVLDAAGALSFVKSLCREILVLHSSS
jgi:hypothetical protein